MGSLKTMHPRSKRETHIPLDSQRSVETLRIGLLGRGNVGSAFVSELQDLAGSIRREFGFDLQLKGVLRRSEGDFQEILETSDVIVELMGGREGTRDYVKAALEHGRHVVTANK